jgi:2-polyprenyl-3-methyl-5-hydroxy-6-metoxy-1,4-benzoquinol methylase
MTEDRDRVEKYWRTHYEDIRLTANGDEATWLDYASDPQRGLRLQAQTFGLVLEALGTLTNLRVLDAGCGWGRFTSALSALGARAVGLDIVEGTIEKLRATKPETEWTSGNFLDPAVVQKIGMFDRIVAIESFQCAGPPLSCLEALWPAIAPGGRLVAIMPNASCPIVQRALASLSGNLFAIEPSQLIAGARELPGLARYAVRGLSFAADQWLAPYVASPWAEDASAWPTANRIMLVCERAA